MPTTDFPPPIDELLEEFEDLYDWEERYEYILDLARSLPPLPAEWQTDANQVRGCMSTVWMVINENSNEKTDQMVIQADSDSLIVKGLIVILLSLYANQSPAQILQMKAEETFERLGLTQHLSPNRRNGLFSMVQKIRERAVQIEAGSPL